MLIPMAALLVVTLLAMLAIHGAYQAGRATGFSLGRDEALRNMGRKQQDTVRRSAERCAEQCLAARRQILEQVEGELLRMAEACRLRIRREAGEVDNERTSDQPSDS